MYVVVVAVVVGAVLFSASGFEHEECAGEYSPCHRTCCRDRFSTFDLLVPKI